MSRIFRGIVQFVAYGALTFSGCNQHSCPTTPVDAAKSERVVAVEAARAPIRRVIVITIDGLKPENYLHPDQKGLKVPTLRWFVQNGAISAGVTSVFPTLTYPAHTSIVTGANPGRHRIVSNYSFEPLEDDLDGWRWYSEEIAVDPIWRVAQSNGLDTAMIHWPVTVGAQVRWLVPEYWRASNRQDQKLLRSVSTPRLLDQVAAKYPEFWSRYRPPKVTDDSLTDIALHVLAVGEPRLLLLHLVEVDGAQHRHGIDSPEARLAIEKDDQQVARILAALEQSNALAETAVVIASDHGFRKATHVVRPCTLLTEAGLISTQGTQVTGWKAALLANAGQAYVYVKDPSDEDTRARVLQIYSARQKEPDSGIERLYDQREIRELGGDPEAFLALAAAEDFQFAAGCLGKYQAQGGNRATHGFDPRSPDMQASLLMVGPGIAHGRIPDARLIDIAPTVAQWLGLQLPSAEGVPLRVVPTP